MTNVVNLNSSAGENEAVGHRHGRPDGESFQYFSIDIEGDVAVVSFDTPGKSMNTLNARVLDELEWAIDEVEANANVLAVVLISAKEDCFVAGADIEILRDVNSREMGEEIPRRGQRAFARWANCSKLTLAAIRGACLGGGMELALACHARIAADHPKTVLGLPEVKLGLFPAGGGTQRLPPLVGLRAALDMMLTGKNVYPRRAKKMGLVDDVVTPWGLRATAVTAARQLSSAGGRPTRKPRTLAEKSIEGHAAGRAVVFQQARKMVDSSTRGNFPAPYAILDCVKTGLEKGSSEGYAREIECFGRLTQSEQARALIGLFFAQQSAKKTARSGQDTDGTEIDSIAVLGAGLMGAGIALTSVRKGMRVLLRDTSDAALARGLRQINEELSRLARRRVISNFEYDTQLTAIAAQTSLEGVAGAQLVIEAVFEDLELKHRVLREVEELVSDECVIGTNTSALSIAKIAEGCHRPSNVVGMHYFSPVHKMPLLEVVRAPGTSQRAVDVAVDVGHRQGKTVIVVADQPGFYTTRILAPYLDEAVLMAASGYDLHELDEIMVDAGFPVGPITLFDEVGIDTIAKIGVDLREKFGARLMAAKPEILLDMVSAGLSGRKSGSGFFRYDGDAGKSPVRRILARGLRLAAGGKQRRDIDPNARAILARHASPAPAGGFGRREIVDRMLSRMVNEAVRCLEEGVITTPADGDLGAVFGLGFPPHHGGPFRYVDAVGPKHVVGRLDGLASKYGERFAPAQSLIDMALSDAYFHTKAPSGGQAKVAAGTAEDGEMAARGSTA